MFPVARIPISQSEIELSSAQDAEGVPAELSAAAMRKCHHRTGALAAFLSFEQFAQYADELLDLVHDFASSATVRKEVGYIVLCPYNVLLIFV